LLHIGMCSKLLGMQGLYPGLKKRWKSLGLMVPTKLVTVGRIWTPPLPVITILHPVIFLSLDLLRSTWLASDVQQTLISSVPWCDSCLKVSDDHMEVWCIPSVAHVPCEHRSRDKAVVIKWLSPSFWNFILMGNCVKQLLCCYCH